MDKISFLDLEEKHRNNSERIQEIEGLGVDYEQIIIAKRYQIEALEKQIEAIQPEKMKDFEKMAAAPMEEIQRIEEDIVELRASAGEKQKLSLENIDILKKAQERREELKQQAEKEYQEEIAKLEKTETKEVKEAKKELADYQKQLEKQEEEEANNPNKVKDLKWKEFLQKEIAKREEIINSKNTEDIKNGYFIVKEDQLKEIDQQYLAFKKAVSKDYMPEEYKNSNPVLEKAKQKRQEQKEEESKKGTPLNTEELLQEAREEGDLPQRETKQVPKDNRVFSNQQAQAWKGSPLNTEELLQDKAHAGTPLNTEELLQEAREEGDLPKRETKPVPKDDRVFSEEQKNAWKGTPLDTEELLKESRNVKIKFDQATGAYFYTDEGNDQQYKLNIFKADGQEEYSEAMKARIVEHLIESGMDAKKANMLDPYIYMLLNLVNPKLRDQYVAAIDNPEKGLDGLEIEYDLRKLDDQKQKKEQTAKFSFAQKWKMKKRAKYHEKNGLAKMLRDKSKTKLVAILAALGIGGSALALNSNNQSSQEAFRMPSPVQDLQEEDSLLPFIPKEEEKDREEEKEEEKDVRIGKYVTIRQGAHLYRDPYDAVYETLGKPTNEAVVTKTIEDNRTYQVTREGLYCPDGTCIEIENGDLKSAMEKQGIDTKILENIDTEELERQGYKRMLHVTSTGIAQWIEEGDSLEAQVDRLGNRVNRTSSEIQRDSKNTYAKTQTEELSRG